MTESLTFHTPKQLSNYLAVWNYHSHVKDPITFPPVTPCQKETDSSDFLLERVAQY